MFQSSFVASKNQKEHVSKVTIIAAIFLVIVLLLSGYLYWNYQKNAPTRMYMQFDTAIKDKDYAKALAVYRQVATLNASDKNNNEILQQMEADVTRKTTSVIKQIDTGTEPSDDDLAYLAGLGELTSGRIAGKIRERGEMYLCGKIEESHWLRFVTKIGALPNVKGAVGDIAATQTQLTELRPSFIKASELALANKYLEADEAWSKLAEQNLPPFAANILLAKKQHNLEAYYKTTMAKAETMLKYRRFLAARRTLNELQGTFADDPQIKSNLAVCQEALPAELEPYNDHIRHIALRPLIVDEALASKLDIPTEVNRDHITSGQFWRLLENLRSKNYVLIRGDAFYDEKGRQSVYVPAGKKPLVLCFMDSEYTQALATFGVEGALHLGEDDNYLSETFDKNQTSKMTDQGAVALLETFLTQYPDFTLDGARATIALTGRYGVMGHILTQEQHTNANEQLRLLTGEITLGGQRDFATSKKEASGLADSLLKRGYIIASATYDAINLPAVRDDVLAEDLALWQKEVTPIVGPVTMLFSPRGHFEQYGTERSQKLIDAGYSVFTGYGDRPYIQESGRAFHVDLTPVTGYTLEHPDDYKLGDAFDVEAVR